MGARGPAKKPTALSLLQGVQKVHPERINKNEPQPKGEIEPPQMSANARGVWDQVAPDMIRAGVLTSWDVPMFVELCEAFVIARLARANVMREATGQLVAVPGQPHPMTSWVKAVHVITALGGRFGMTPSDRTRLATVQTEATRAGSRELLSG